ncbi:hypothetical protein FRX31_024168, partial [Thalictrum thalictroides]
PSQIDLRGSTSSYQKIRVCICLWKAFHLYPQIIVRKFLGKKQNFFVYRYTTIRDKGFIIGNTPGQVRMKVGGEESLRYMCGVLGMHLCGL